MSRPRQITLSALNFTVHPHDREGQSYVKLLKGAYSLEKSIKIRGSTHALIGTMTEVVEGQPEKGLEGDLFQFTQINFDSEWLDTNNNKPISPDDIKSEISIPEHLKPNLERSRYIFYPKIHRLIFVSESGTINFSPLLAERFFQLLFSDVRVVRDFPNIDVTVEQSRQALDTILNRMSLEQLIIVIKRPNPDDDADDDATIEKVLDDQNARQQTIELKREKTGFLKPNEENKKLARVATSNGHVYGKGKDDRGKAVQKNTHKHPIKEKYSFYPNQEFRGWFHEQAESVVKVINGK